MALYPKEVRWRFSSETAKRYMAHGRKLLGELVDRIVGGGLLQGARTVTLPDGTIIRVLSYEGGVPIVEIVSAPTAAALATGASEDDERDYVCSLYMEAGMLELGSTPSATPATLRFNPATSSTFTFNGEVRAYLSLSGPDDAVRVVSVRQGARPSVGPCRATEPIRDGDGVITRSVIDKQTAQFKLPASLWSGLMRRWVQGVYGTPTADYSAVATYGSSGDTLSGYDFRGATAGVTDGIISDGDYRYWRVRINSWSSFSSTRRITYSKMLFSACGELLREYLRSEESAELSVANRAALVTYLLASSTGVGASTYEVFEASSKPLVENGFATGDATHVSYRTYGWKFNDSGTQAIGIHAVSADPYAGSSRVATITFSFTGTGDAKVPTHTVAYGATVSNNSVTTDVPRYCWFEGDNAVVLYSDDAQVSTSSSNTSYECDDPDTPNGLPWHDLTHSVGVCDCDDPCPGISCDSISNQTTIVLRRGYYTGYGSSLALHTLVSSGSSARSISTGGETLQTETYYAGGGGSCDPAIACSAGDLSCPSEATLTPSCNEDKNASYPYLTGFVCSPGLGASSCSSTGDLTCVEVADCPGGSGTSASCTERWYSLEITNGYGSTGKNYSISAAFTVPRFDCSAVYPRTIVSRSKFASSITYSGEMDHYKFEMDCSSATGYVCGATAACVGISTSGVFYRNADISSFVITEYLYPDLASFDWAVSQTLVSSAGDSAAQTAITTHFVGVGTFTALDSVTGGDYTAEGGTYLSCLPLVDTGPYGGSGDYSFNSLIRAQQSSGGAYGRHTSIVTDGTLPFVDDDFAQFGGFPSTGANRFSYIGWA